MHTKDSGVTARLVLERSYTRAEVHPRRPPMIDTPHHLVFHKLIAIKLYICIYVYTCICTKYTCLFCSLPKLSCFSD